MRLLLVEDEAPIADVVKQGLEQAGYAVDIASDGRAALICVSEKRYSLLVLDVMLPHLDGWGVCEALRSSGNPVPILMLTARDSVGDRVRGLEMGADDYLPKPFDFAELLARVRALLRRDRVHKSAVIEVADLQIDTAQRLARRAGVEISLTPREFALLEALAGHEGQVLTREVIQERVWLDEDSYSNTVDVYVGLLRRKIDAGHAAKLIQTVHGVGYVLRAPTLEKGSL